MMKNVFTNKAVMTKS